MIIGALIGLFIFLIFVRIFISAVDPDDIYWGVIATDGMIFTLVCGFIGAIIGYFVS